MAGDNLGGEDKAEKPENKGNAAEEAVEAEQENSSVMT